MRPSRTGRNWWKPGAVRTSHPRRTLGIQESQHEGPNSVGPPRVETDLPGAAMARPEECSGKAEEMEQQARRLPPGDEYHKLARQA